MFLHNKYYKWYFNIVDDRKQDIQHSRLGYERHHIIPKCMGGSNSSENLVYLTCREHFICHRLLTKITIGKDKRKMNYAFWCIVNFKNRRGIRVNSKIYEESKRLIQKQLSEERTGVPFTKEIMEKRNKKFNKTLLERYGGKSWWQGRSHQDESKRKMSIYRTGRKMPKWVGEKISKANAGVTYEQRYGFEGAKKQRELRRKTPEERKTLSLKLKGRQKSERTKALMRKPKSESHKQAMRDAWERRRVNHP